jgi:hypothetical protein
MKRTIFIGICIAAFVWLSLLAIDFINKNQREQSHSRDDYNIEGFRAAVTRASDCNCLPGYIPSKDSSEYNGKFYTFEDYLVYVPDNTKNTYSIDTRHSPCESFDKMMNSPRIDRDTLDRHRYSGFISKDHNNCNILSKKESTGVYFCQKLGNPEQKRDCY